MPLLDHFRPPLHGPRDWHSFHHTWATYLAVDINRRLPKGYFAEPHVQFGIEIDVATFDQNGAGQEGVPPFDWTPPGPALSAPMATLTDLVEVKIYFDDGGYVLAGAIELVSPANKDRPASRSAFVSKCASYVQQGVGLLLIDIVTERRADLHEELLTRLNIAGGTGKSSLYAASYRPVERAGQPHLDVWHEALGIGAILPKMPLWLRGGLCLPIELETVYSQACQDLRISVNGT